MSDLLPARMLFKFSKRRLVASDIERLVEITLLRSHVSRCGLLGRGQETCNSPGKAFWKDACAQSFAQRVLLKNALECCPHD